MPLFPHCFFLNFPQKEDDINHWHFSGELTYIADVLNFYIENSRVGVLTRRAYCHSYAALRKDVLTSHSKWLWLQTRHHYAPPIILKQQQHGSQTCGQAGSSTAGFDLPWNSVDGKTERVTSNSMTAHSLPLCSKYSQIQAQAHLVCRNQDCWGLMSASTRFLECIVWQRLDLISITYTETSVQCFGVVLQLLSITLSRQYSSRPGLNPII